MLIRDATVPDPRQASGQRIADRFKITRDGAAWIVASESQSYTKYRVDPAAGSCSCPDHEVRRVKCKHLWAVEYTITESIETEPNGKTTVTRTKTVRATYRQEWPAYNAAQTHEHERFLLLLRELCDGIEQPRKPSDAPGCRSRM